MTNRNQNLQGTIDGNIRFTGQIEFDKSVIFNDITDFIDAIKLGISNSGGGGNSNVNILQVETILSENINAYSLVTIDGYKANSNNLSHADKILGIMEQTNTTGNYEMVTTMGEVTNTSWSFPILSKVFLNGTNLSTVPPTTGFVKCIGTTKDSNTIVLDQETSIIL
jgi:hypothetical protein